MVKIKIGLRECAVMACVKIKVKIKIKIRLRNETLWRVRMDIRNDELW